MTRGMPRRIEALTAGFRAQVAFNLHGTPIPPCPYGPHTAGATAWRTGLHMGHRECARAPELMRAVRELSARDPAPLALPRLGKGAIRDDSGSSIPAAVALRVAP